MMADNKQGDTGTYTQVIFLDTNAVHFAVLAVSLCVANGEDITRICKQQFMQMLRELGLKFVESHYEKGYFIVQYLLTRSRQDPDTMFYFSPMTRLELICGGLRGEAIVSASKSRVPNRWYTRLDEEEIRLYLEPDGYNNVNQNDELNSELLRNLGINLEENKSDKDVLQFAAELLQSVFVDVQDCVVYASAFELQADEFISNDKYMGSVARGIANPGSAPNDLEARFRTAKTQLSSWASGANLWAKDDIKFPTVVDVGDIKQFLKGSTV